MIEVDELKKTVAETKKQKDEADERIKRAIDRVSQTRREQEG